MLDSMTPARRSAAMVISAFLDPQSTPPWYARISYYDDALAPKVQVSAQTSADAVCEVVRRWLEAVVAEQGQANDGSVTTQ